VFQLRFEASYCITGVTKTPHINLRHEQSMNIEQNFEHKHQNIEQNITRHRPTLMYEK
jgi:hypothetical protein